VPGPADDEDDWYLRRGRHAAGPLLDVPWQAELDQATRWLDELPLSGVIVELAAGSGWWSALLAQKGELWVTDTDPSRLDVARRRLVAHGTRAHLHLRDPRAVPDRRVDAVFSAFLLGACRDGPGLDAQARAVRAGLRTGGTFAFIEARHRVDGAAVAGPRGQLRSNPPGLILDVLARCGFGDVEIRATDRAFLMGTATATGAADDTP
jgi:demethylmenaquinone methyltransferase/2-methoxy-6-polyprenyl-1,4-benzoquinol methylase